jgi:hypothetical protein
MTARRRARPSRRQKKIRQPGRPTDPRGGPPHWLKDLPRHLPLVFALLSGLVRAVEFLSATWVAAQLVL